MTNWSTRGSVAGLGARQGFVDPDTRRPLASWADALDQVDEPAHVVTFGRQVHSKGILGGSEEAGRHIGYLTKYLTKSISEVVEPATDRQRRHADRLHAELRVTPCSPRCPVWLLYGVQPLGVTSKTVPGHCKGRAHRRTTLGLPGRRVLVSRKWSGKTLADHKADRKAFVAKPSRPWGSRSPSLTRPGCCGARSRLVIRMSLLGRICSCTPSPSGSPGGLSTTERCWPRVGLHQGRQIFRQFHWQLDRGAGT